MYEDSSIIIGVNTCVRLSALESEITVYTCIYSMYACSPQTVKFTVLFSGFMSIT